MSAAEVSRHRAATAASLTLSAECDQLRAAETALVAAAAGLAATAGAALADLAVVDRRRRAATAAVATAERARAAAATAAADAEAAVVALASRPPAWVWPVADADADIAAVVAAAADASASLDALTCAAAPAAAAAAATTGTIARACASVGALHLAACAAVLCPTAFEVAAAPPRLFGPPPTAPAAADAAVGTAAAAAAAAAVVRVGAAALTPLADVRFDGVSSDGALLSAIRAAAVAPSADAGADAEVEDDDGGPAGDAAMIALAASVSVVRPLAQQYSLYDCIDAFVSPDTLAGDDAPRCRRCDDRVPARKAMALARLPDVCIVHLKRFDPVDRTKCDVPVSTPAVLDLSRYYALGTEEPARGGCDPAEEQGATTGAGVKAGALTLAEAEDDADAGVDAGAGSGALDEAEEDEEDGQFVYDLTGVSLHSGTVSGGHYTAIGRNFLTGRWYDYNDSSVSPLGPVTEANLQRRDAYVLFYHRRRTYRALARRWGLAPPGLATLDPALAAVGANAEDDYLYA
jgi:hypothetical protein